jgi:hypothetical protein
VEAFSLRGPLAAHSDLAIFFPLTSLERRRKRKIEIFLKWRGCDGLIFESTGGQVRHLGRGDLTRPESKKKAQAVFRYRAKASDRGRGLRRPCELFGVE